MPGAVLAHPPALPPTREASSVAKMIPVGDRWAMVDDADYERLARYRWHLSEKGYAYRFTTTAENLPTSTLRMHREILDTPSGVEVDHVNGSILDNRRVNLREATGANNRRNSKKYAGRGGERTTSIYKGVSFCRETGRWRVQINVDGRRRFSARYDTEEEAARGYDAAARRLHGEYASLNFPRPGERDAFGGGTAVGRVKG